MKIVMMTLVLFSVHSIYSANQEDRDPIQTLATYIKNRDVSKVKNILASQTYK